jgi:hypothetical protein
MWGDNLIYRSIVSDWTISAIDSAHSGLPLLVTGSGCAGSGILGTCMPSVVAGQAGRQYRYGKTSTGANVSWDPNNANYIGKVQYVNPNAFTVLNGGTCTAGTATPYHSTSGQAYYVCNGPENFVPGNASRVAPIKGLWSEPTYNTDLALRRTFPIVREMKLALEVTMTNVANHVIYKGASASVASGTNLTFGTVSAIANNPRDIQGGARISW